MVSLILDPPCHQPLRRFLSLVLDPLVRLWREVSLLVPLQNCLLHNRRLDRIQDIPNIVLTQGNHSKWVESSYKLQRIKLLLQTASFYSSYLDPWCSVNKSLSYMTLQVVIAILGVTSICYCFQSWISNFGIKIVVTQLVPNLFGPQTRLVPRDKWS